MDFEEKARRRRPAAEKEAPRRDHPGGKKATVAGDEEALGGAQKEGFVSPRRNYRMVRNERSDLVSRKAMACTPIAWPI